MLLRAMGATARTLEATRAGGGTVWAEKGHTVILKRSLESGMLEELWQCPGDGGQDKRGSNALPGPGKRSPCPLEGPALALLQLCVPPRYVWGAKEMCLEVIVILRCLIVLTYKFMYYPKSQLLSLVVCNKGQRQGTSPRPSRAVREKEGASDITEPLLITPLVKSPLYILQEKQHWEKAVSLGCNPPALGAEGAEGTNAWGQLVRAHLFAALHPIKVFVLPWCHLADTAFSWFPIGFLAFFLICESSLYIVELHTLSKTWIQNTPPFFWLSLRFLNVIFKCFI